MGLGSAWRGSRGSELFLGVFRFWLDDAVSSLQRFVEIFVPSPRRSTIYFVFGRLFHSIRLPRISECHVAISALCTLLIYPVRRFFCVCVPYISEDHAYVLVNISYVLIWRFSLAESRDSKHPPPIFTRANERDGRGPSAAEVIKNGILYLVSIL